MQRPGPEPTDPERPGDDGWRVVDRGDDLVERWRPTRRDRRAIVVAAAMVVVAFAGVLLFVATLRTPEPETDQQSPAVEALVAVLAQRVDGGPIDLAAATRFAWDRVGFFGSFNPNSSVNDALFGGRAEFRASRNLTGQLEHLLVFADGDELAGWAYVSEAVDGFGLDRVLGTVLERDRAVIEVVTSTEGARLVVPPTTG